MIYETAHQSGMRPEQPKAIATLCQPHLYALVTDGTLRPTGRFVAFPKIDPYALEHLFRHRVLRMLLRERRIDEAVIRTLLGWRQSWFSLHNGVRIGAAGTETRRAVAEYILRSPFALEKVRDQAKSGTIIYQPGLRSRSPRLSSVFGHHAEHRVHRAA